MKKITSLIISTLMLTSPALAWGETYTAPAAVPVEYHTIVPKDSQSIAVGSTEVNAVVITRAQKLGNELLQNLPTLFVLNALFADHSNGILTPGPATLGNIIILYRLFFQTHAFNRTA